MSSEKTNLGGRPVTVTSLLSTYILSQALLRTRQYSKGSLLDIGCGSMPYKKHFQHDHYWGIDWPSSQNQLALDLFADAHHIPLANFSMDTVICTEVLEHVKYPHEVVAEIARLLKPEGMLIISAPFVHLYHEMPYDYYRYTDVGLKEMLRDSGFEIIEYYPRGGMFVVIFDLSIRLLYILIKKIDARLFFGKGWFRNIMTLFFVEMPQRIFLALLAVIPLARFEDFFLSTTKHMTLGHVIVAKKVK